MRKRLQQHSRQAAEGDRDDRTSARLGTEDIGSVFTAKIVELLARPRLEICRRIRSAKVLEALLVVLTDCPEHVLPEIVDFAEARKTIGDDALYINPLELHRVDERRILRYDLTLPFLMTARL